MLLHFAIFINPKSNKININIFLYYILHIFRFQYSLFDTTKGFTENFSCQIWNIILVIKNRPFLLLKLSNFTRIFGYFQWKRSARGYLVISQKRARFFSVNFIYIGGIYIYILAGCLRFMRAWLVKTMGISYL